jgi:hypothetical protein
MRRLLFAVVAVLSAAEPAKAESWGYHESTDTMTDAKGTYAYLDSQEPGILNGYTKATGSPKLVIAEKGKMIFITSDVATFDCVSACSILLRFDDAKAVNYIVDRDTSLPSVLRFEWPADVLRSLKRASIIKVQLPIRNIGLVVFTYDVAGLDMARLQ